jgi:hypothetical protein
MKASEIVSGIKDLLTLSKKESEVVENIELEKQVDLSEDIEVIAEEVEVVLEEEAPVAESKPADVVNQVVANFATQEELSQVKMELLEMIKSIIEDKTSVGDKEVPQELSAEVELEQVEEIVHSPESGVEEKKVVNFAQNKQSSTVQERINQMLFK